jgi:hypothetical protein
MAIIKLLFTLILLTNIAATQVVKIKFMMILGMVRYTLLTHPTYLTAG